MGSVQSSADLFARARAVIPGGVNSPVRAFQAVGGTPRFIAGGDGCYLTDVDGARYTDYVCSWGPLILGHAHPEVVRAATDAVRRGSSYGAPTELEVALAEEIVGRVGGVEKIRLVSSGTEAGMSAIRLARGVTGRTKVVKFAGHYHGHADALLVEAGSGVATLGLPNSPGVTPGAVADTIVLGWNDPDELATAFSEHGDDIALVVCEPVPANMGVVPAADGYLEMLADMAARHGALLCFDEVMSGFRVARGGMVEVTGITPDLVAFGKVVGGGFPLAAFGGRAELMDHLAPEGPVYQAGTLSGNPVAVAAGLTTLRQLDTAAYARLDGLAERLTAGLAGAFDDAGIPARIPHVRNLFSVFFAEEEIRDFRGARAADHEAYADFFTGMLERGHYLPPSGFEAMFVSLAHDEQVIDGTVAAAREVAATMSG